MRKCAIILSMQPFKVGKSEDASLSLRDETPKITSGDLFRQLTTYADAITAFSFVQAVGFIYAAAGTRIWNASVRG